MCSFCSRKFLHVASLFSRYKGLYTEFHVGFRHILIPYFQYYRRNSMRCLYLLPMLVIARRHDLDQIRWICLNNWDPLGLLGGRDLLILLSLVRPSWICGAEFCLYFGFGFGFGWFLFWRSLVRFLCWCYFWPLIFYLFVYALRPHCLRWLLSEGSLARLGRRIRLWQCLCLVFGLIGLLVLLALVPAHLSYFLLCVSCVVFLFVHLLFDLPSIPTCHLTWICLVLLSPWGCRKFLFVKCRSFAVPVLW